MSVTNITSDKNTDSLAQYKRILSNHKLIVASNRGPVDYHINANGDLAARRGSGGIVTALSNLIRNVPFTWVSSAIGEGDRKALESNRAGAFLSPINGQQVSLSLVSSPRRVYHKFYNVICNPVLWFLQHYMWNPAYTPNIDADVIDAWITGYIPVNQAFSQAVVEECKHSLEAPFIIIHDYHLYLVPEQIRQQVPTSRILDFIHIPWPDASYWQILPWHMVKMICESLCASDIVGFQTNRDCRSFLATCETYLPDAEVDYKSRIISTGTHKTVIKTYPLSIDVSEILSIADSPRTLDYERNLSQLVAEKTIVIADRAEPSKNIIRSLKAYRLLLKNHEEWIGKVKLMAFLVPSRTHIRQYKRYLDDIRSEVQSINNDFSTAEWEPISTFYDNNYTQAIAGLKLYDVLMINPVIDGMNLLAKEGPIVNKKSGVLILSTTAGAHEQFMGKVISVAPTDIIGISEALETAISKTPRERVEWHNKLLEQVKSEDILWWIQRQLDDLSALA